MGDEKSPSSRDRELLIPVANTVDDDDDASSKPSPSSNSSSHHAGREVSFFLSLASYTFKFLNDTMFDLIA